MATKKASPKPRFFKAKKKPASVKKKGIKSLFIFSTAKGKFLIFIAVFAILGGGYMLFNSFAGTQGVNGKIAFSENGKVAVVNNDGTGKIVISNSEHLQSPVFSYDSRRLAFFCISNVYGVCISNADGTGFRRIIDGSYNIKWHPIKKDILILDKNQSGDMYEIRYDGTGFRKINAIAVDAYYLGISPDATKIVTIETGKLTIRNYNGTNPIQISNPNYSAYNSNPSWSSDGKFIVFNGSLDTSGGHKNGIIRINTDGLNPIVLVEDSNYTHSPVVSPDSKFVLYGHGSGVGDTGFARIVSINGGPTVRSIYRSDNLRDGLSWQALPLRSKLFYLKNANESGMFESIYVGYGLPGDLPISGDWNGDGRDSIGVYRPSNQTFYLNNTNAPGATAVTVKYGNNGDLPVVGDWNGDGRDSIGVRRPSTMTFYLNNTNIGGATAITVKYGNNGDLPISGDWNSDGTDSIGVYRPSNSSFYLNNTNLGGATATTAAFGLVGDKPLVGDWDGDRRSSIGVVR